jgi:hypothetical protein
MTKARTKSARRKQRKLRKITLPGGMKTPQPPTQGRRTDLNQEPANTLALATRARLTGCTPDEARDPLTADDIGRCIRYLHSNPDNRRELFAIWNDLTAARHHYVTLCLSLPVAAPGATLPVLPEQIQTDTTTAPDTRSVEERAAAARTAWAAAFARTAALPPPQRAALRAHLIGIGRAAWDSYRTRPTTTGILIVAALYSLREKYS